MELSFDSDKRKKHVKSDADNVPTGTTLKVQVSSSLDALAKQLEAEIQAIKNEQDAMLHQLTATSPKMPNRNPTHDKRCFICDLANVHTLGPRHCPQVPLLIKDGLASFNQVG